MSFGSSGLGLKLYIDQLFHMSITVLSVSLWVILSISFLSMLHIQILLSFTGRLVYTHCKAFSSLFFEHIGQAAFKAWCFCSRSTNFKPSFHASVLVYYMLFLELSLPTRILLPFFYKCGKNFLEVLVMQKHLCMNRLLIY